MTTSHRPASQRLPVRLAWTLGTALLATAPAALAQYRCTSPDGHVTFSDRPCSPETLRAAAEAAKAANGFEGKISRRYDQPTLNSATGPEIAKRLAFAKREFESLAREAYRRHQLHDDWREYRLLLCTPHSSGSPDLYAGVTLLGITQLDDQAVTFRAHEDDTRRPDSVAYVGVKFEWRAEGPCVRHIDRWWDSH